jgi:Hypothetical glycosyl hydrolase family 15
MSGWIPVVERDRAMRDLLTAGRKSLALGLRAAAYALLLLCAALPLQAAAAATGSTKFIPTFAVYYGGGPTLVAADAAKLAKFDLISTDRWRYYEISPNTWAAIKAINPNVQIYLYQMGSEAPSYLDGMSQVFLNGLGRYDVSRGHPMGSLNGDHPELFLLDSLGNRIYNVPHSNPAANEYWHLMDFGAAAYQSYWLTAVKADIVDQPWVADGIFADNCIALNFGPYSAVPAKYPNTAAWNVAMNSFASAITAELHGVGQKVWCNRGETKMLEGSAAWRALDASANPPDVLLEEGAFAVGWGDAAVHFHQESEWKRQVDTMGAIRNSKVAMTSHTQLAEGEVGTDNLGKPVTFWQTLWYSLGSFLLAKNDDLGNAYFKFHGPGGTNKIWWFDEYDKIDLGRATMKARIEETSPSITGTAGWTLGDTSRTWSGGTAAYATTAGTQATFTFTGTSVSWIGARGPQTGIARVWLDGTLVAEVDTYSTSEETQANVYSATDLAAGNHTLTIEVTGLKNAASTDTYIVVDAFDVNPKQVTTAMTANGPANVYWREFEKGYVYVNPTHEDVASVPLPQPGRQLTRDNMNSPPESIPIVGEIALNSHHAAIVLKTQSANDAENGENGVTRSEENSAAVNGSPADAWVLRGPEVAAFSGGAAGSSNVPGATATLTFTGTAVSWIGLECSACGIATVSIDGGAATSVDTAGAATPGSPGLASKAVFTASGLAPGTHTLVITVTGTTTSGDTHIVVDAFDVTP